MARDLTAKQRAFVLAYVRTRNATEAASIAGYKGNRNTLHSVGTENLRKPAIRAEVERYWREQGMGLDEIVGRLAAQAAADPTAALAELSGCFDVPSAAARLNELGVGHLVREIVPTRDGVRVRWHDAQRALELLAKAAGLFVERIELSGVELQLAIETQLAEVLDAEVVEDGPPSLNSGGPPCEDDRGPS